MDWKAEFEQLLEAADEYRRLEIVTPMPANVHARRVLDQAAVKLDAILARHRVPDVPDVAAPATSPAT